MNKNKRINYIIMEKGYRFIRSLKKGDLFNQLFFNTFQFFSFIIMFFLISSFIRSSLLSAFQICTGLPVRNPRR